MKTVREIFQRRKVNGDIGLEIEVEGRNLPELIDDYWRYEYDGSLRGESAEYVLRKPLTLDGIREALDDLDQKYIEFGSIVHDSIRAGVHVHINCQELSVIELYNFMTLYIILENVLVKYCGDHREGNLFCLRCCDAEYLINALVKTLRERNFRQLTSDNLRYASMNVKALGTYGSLEFRSMRGTRDLDSIFEWVSILYSLKEMALTFKSPRDIIEQFSVLGVRGFAAKCLGNNYAKLIGRNNYDMDLVAGMRYAQDIAYAVNWEEMAKPPKIVGGLEFPPDMDDEEINEPMEDF